MGLHRGALQHWKINTENEMETGLYEALSCGDYISGVSPRCGVGECIQTRIVWLFMEILQALLQRSTPNLPLSITRLEGLFKSGRLADQHLELIKLHDVAQMPPRPVYETTG